MSCAGSKCCPPKSETTKDNIKDEVKEYYGKTLQTTNDLKTSACTLDKIRMPKFVREALSEVHDEVTSK